jgi:hypothetical protein
MFHEICMAIVPPHGMAETLRGWNELKELLAEPARKRQR